MKENKTLVAVVTLGLGAWLIALPLTLGYKTHDIGISDLLSGCLLIVFGFLSLSPDRIWSRWAIGVVGLWLQMAPLVFWAPQAVMYINDTLVGAAAIIFAFLLTKKEEETSLSSIPKGWSYNPSGWAHRIPTVALALLCFFFSRYMACFQLGYIDHIWDPFFIDGTFHVITSKISKDFPVSDAGMGALCYTIESLLGWQGGSKRWFQIPWLVFAFGFLVIPVGVVSITLIILQPLVVGAWCSWCLATAACMLMMIVLTAAELSASFQFLREMRQKGNSVWHAFWKGGAPVQAIVSIPPKESHGMGFTLPWNLVASTLLGIWLMVSPAVMGIQGELANSHYILGPMIVACSVIATAEVFRSVRFCNILFGLALIVAPWVVTQPGLLSTWNSVIAGVLIVALSFRRGKIRSRYGSLEKWIR